MAYVLPTDFRDDSLTFYARGCVLKVEEADDTELTAAIAWAQTAVDELLNDHFETESNVTLQLEGDGSRFLYIPKRIQSIASVNTTDEDGNATLQAASTYRKISSLNPSFNEAIHQYDWLVSLDHLVDTPYPHRWPTTPGSVTIVGNFSWATVPDEVKRLTALIVYDHFKPIGDSTRRADRWQTVGGTIYERPDETATGLPEADAIIRRMRKPDPSA